MQKHNHRGLMERSVGCMAIAMCLLLSATDAHADKEGGEKRISKLWGLSFEYAHFVTSHLDDDTQTMIGSTGPGGGLGAQLALLFKVNDRVSIGGNFDFTFMINPGSGYTYIAILPNIGALLRVGNAKVKFHLMFDYVFGGLIGADKGKLDCDGGICVRPHPYSTYAGGPSPAMHLVFGKNKFRIGLKLRYTYLVLPSVTYTMSGLYTPMTAKARTHYLQAGIVMHFGG